MIEQKELLTAELNYVSREARRCVLDAVACALHNDGASLSGNTAGSDIEWLARGLWQRESREVPGAWDMRSDSTKDHYRSMACLFIEVMPGFAERVGHRMMLAAKAFRTLERGLRVSASNKSQGEHSVTS